MHPRAPSIALAIVAAALSLTMPATAQSPSPSASPSALPVVDCPSPSASASPLASPVAPVPSAAPSEAASPAPSPSAAASPCAVTVDPEIAELAATYDAMAREHLAAQGQWNRRFSRARTLEQVKRAFGDYHDFHRPYVDAVYALAWTEALRPLIDEWKRLQDASLAFDLKMSRSSSFARLDRFYAQDKGLIDDKNAAMAALREALGLPPIE